ncbi:MAG: SAM-dependent methyltransferase [Patescibacteria group bacterium]|nr:SAM-dependent methyltransferase [Patescibacteria group bacterium]
MNNKCSFGQKFQKYWDRLYDLFSRFDNGIRVDREGLFSATPEKISLHQARKMDCKTIVDGFCGIGGNSIGFAKVCDKVYAIENNKNRIEMAKNNAKIYEVEKKIDFICGDFFEELKGIKAEGIFIDLQWGGPEYKELKKFKLFHFKPDGAKILKIAFANFKKVAMKVPDNFDLSELEIFDKSYEIEDNIMYDRVLFRTVYFVV